MTRAVVHPGPSFRVRAAASVADREMQRALANLDVRFRTAAVVARDHADWKARAAALRRRTIAELAPLLDELQASLERNGAVVHRAATPAEAAAAVVAIARRRGATRVVKGKSMATEEIDLDDALAAAGCTVLETDLGEYVAQLAGERPSHIITPIIHKTLDQIAGVLGREARQPLPADREALTAFVRAHLRPAFLAAEIGVTGANFAAADTGTIVVVTNEGNGRLCTTLPPVHVVVMPVEKVVPRFADLGELLPLLTRSATGQRLTNYVTMVGGPRRTGERDGPEELHVVFLDHNRTALLGTPYADMLACIRCGACLNVCPVYRQVGGHAYDAVYTGPMGKVLTPLLSVGTVGRDLPGASSLCGACTEACPVGIPLDELLVRLRADLRHGAPPAWGAAGPGVPPGAAAPLRGAGAPGRGWRLWARAWSSPRGYRRSTAAARWAARLAFGRSRRWTRWAPGLAGWASGRDVPLPAPADFRAWWAQREAAR